jgi:CheY-like chemotaxis protein
MSICLLLENSFKKNYEVVSMNNGLDALLWLDDNIPDLIISDIQMEKMDGYEFLTKLRQRGFTKHTPASCYQENQKVRNVLNVIN